PRLLRLRSRRRGRRRTERRGRCREPLEPVAELGRELAAGIERNGALVHLARAVGVADLFVCLAEQQTRVLGGLGATRALEERLQRVERALEFLGLDARAAQVEPDDVVAHLGLQLHVAAEVLGSRVPILAPVRGLAGASLCAVRTSALAYAIAPSPAITAKPI